MQIDIWSDVVCPWCYIGKRRMEAALERFPHREGVTVVWHSFQLDPTTPKGSNASLTELLAKKYGMSAAQIQASQAQITQLAKAEGLDYHLEKTKPENTLDAHRLLHFAAQHGQQDALKEALLEAYFERGERVGEVEVLLAAAERVGLDRAAAAAVLADPTAFADAVQGDIQAARALGIRGVPFFVIDKKYGVSGAQATDTLLGALSRAWSERPVEVADAAACTDDACEIPKA